MKIAAGLCVLAFLALSRVAPAEPTQSNTWWTILHQGLDTNLRGVSAVLDRSTNLTAVWASGSNGVVLRSIDSGKSWRRIPVSGGGSLDFRGIVAFSRNSAYLMASGEGEKSRIYRTTDGGKTWQLQYTGARKEIFLDTIVCADETHCFVLADPTNGKFLILHTQDGLHWSPLPSDNMPTILPGEGAFAASNTAMAIFENGDLFFGTGGASQARIFHSPDLGRTWTVSDTPIAAGNPSSGIFSIFPVSHDTVVAVGGDYKNPGRSDAVAAHSSDGGKTWTLATRQPSGYRSAVAVLENSRYVAVGPTGSDVSDKDAAHWKPADTSNFNALSMLNHNVWAVGPNGTIAAFKFPIMIRTGHEARDTGRVALAEARHVR